MAVMAAAERCPKCEGPVTVHGRSTHNTSGKLDYLALPDTLEGIEGEQNNAVDTAGTSYERMAQLANVSQQALTRLFIPCTECGREPAIKLSMYFQHQWIEDGKRQAYQHAAELTKELVDRYGDDGGAGSMAAEKLRQLAEGE